MTSLHLDGHSVRRGPRSVLRNVTLTLAPGMRLGITGPNGVGKTTLLHALADQLGPMGSATGRRRLDPPDAVVGLLAQEAERSDEVAATALRRRAGISAADAELVAAANDLAVGAVGADDRYDRAWQRWDRLGAADFDARVGTVVDEVGLSPACLDRPTAALSGGEAARLQLASLLVSRFDVTLLDEPTNDLDAAGLAHLERWVLASEAPLAVVSHDRAFLTRVVTHVAEIDPGTGQLTVFAGGWEAFQHERAVARRRAERAYDDYRRAKGDLERRAQTQREWADRGRSRVRRSASDEPDKFVRNHRLDQTEALAGRAAQTARAAARLDVVERPWQGWDLRLELPDAAPSGRDVVRLDRATVEHPGCTLGPFDLSIHAGDRIVLDGPNGAGKTTVIDLILQRRPPTTGTVRIGSRVISGELEQVRTALDGVDPVASVVARAGGTDSEARRLLATFGIVAEHLDRPATTWSPGERTRAALALLMAAGTNLLVLDEPTNHLDLPAIEQLESALDTFAGTVVFVSHDRAFRERVRTTRTIHVNGGRITGETPGDVRFSF